MKFKELTNNPVIIDSINGSSKFMSFYSRSEKANMTILTTEFINHVLHVTLEQGESK